MPYFCEANRLRISNIRANLQTTYFLRINKRIFKHNKKVSAEQNECKCMQYHWIFHAFIVIPRWPRNAGAQIWTRACKICTQRASKMLGLAKKNSQIYTGNFFKMKILKWKMLNFDWPMQTMAWKSCCAHGQNRAKFKCMVSVRFLILSNGT